MQQGRVNKQGTCVVMIDITWHGHRVYVSSGKLVKPEHFTPNWDKAKQPKSAKLIHASEDNSLALNHYFGQLKLDVERDFLALERKCERKVPITKEMVVALVKNLTGKALPVVPKPKADTSIWAYHAKWKALYAHLHSESYLRKFNGIKTWLERYCPDLRMEQLDEEWVQGYVAWMLVTPSERTGRLPRTGTIGKHLGFFKVMLKFARLPHDWLVNNYTENTPGTDLRYEEVLAIYQHEYLFDELRATADQYVLLTQLGMRYGDWLRFTEKHVQSFSLNGSPRLIYLDFRQGKTKEPVTVAFSDLAEEIWHRYQGQFEKVANQTFNERLKFVGRAAGLTRQVSVTTVSGKDYTTTYMPLWELLTAHTARHTAASLLRKATGNNELAQHTLGHTSGRTTDIYAHPEQLGQVQASVNAWKIVDQGAGRVLKPF